ncbi:hypothetical protein RvY_05647 [Ramazzottius varieornatus]|uniref:SH3 domain-containing protein n=1 Tax=Ramazzottius varieornatus TaxID=947166 RepID=A0A1D1UVR2_RAMVA|nr:hypothetical protein RvY_05647 [Ramazzottius varieornatus]
MVEEPRIEYEQGLNHLSVDDLGRLSVRQAHQLKMQKQSLLSKEERLKGLISQFHRHEQKLDNLKHVRATLQSQEARLRDLRQLKQQVDQRTTVKNQLGEELEKIKALFASREKELAEAVAKVDILTAQLDRTRNAQQQHQGTLSGSNLITSDSPSAALIQAEIERLKQEHRYRLQLVHQQKRKIDEKDATLLQKTLERNKINEKINEIAERISKRRGQPSQPEDKTQASNSNHSVLYSDPKENQDVSTSRQSRESTKGTLNDQHNRSQNSQKQFYPDQSKVLDDPYVPPEQRIHSRDNSQSKTDSRPSQKTASFRSQPPSDQPDKKQPSLNTEIARKSGRSNKDKDDDSYGSEKPPRFELVLREANLPNLVTDTLTRDNNNYMRSSETPDTCSSSSDTPSSLSQSLPISNPPAAKINRHGHVQAIANHHRATEGQLSTEAVPSKRRVKFDPQALLLDASLEGELELVIKTCQQVADPSASNDEGITALHNAICAGHFAIVKFLVEYGCDVNAQDSDGWSPLHCAASCNNLAMCRFLVEHGACIYSTTHSDKETASQKCEEDEADFEGCSQYLLDTLHNLGRINDGVVFAAYDYQAQNADELSFQCGEQLKVLRTSDDDETEWYWAERTLSPPAAGKEARSVPQVGYIPRNLLALYQRVQRTQRGR